MFQPIQISIPAEKQNILVNIKLSLQSKPFTRCFLIIQEHKENFICLALYYDTRTSFTVQEFQEEKALKKFCQYLERENITPDYEICIITS